MKYCPSKSAVIFTSSLAIAFATTSQAQIVQNNQTSFTSSTAFTGDITANLIQNEQSSLAGVTASASALNGTFTAAGLNDGSATGTANETYYAAVNTSGGGVMPDTDTFQLSAGYDISEIQVISGWGDHNLGEQDFQVLFSINGGAYNSIGTFMNNSSVTTGSAAAGSYLTTLSATSGDIASDVTGIQFIFMNPDTSNGAGSVGNSQAGGGSSGGTVIQELQVFGTPIPTPEPASCALMVCAAAGLVIMRRKSANN